MKKPVPTFKTDKEAEEFVANADLSDYDLSGGEIVRFEMRSKDKAVSLRAAREALGCGSRSGQTPGRPLPAIHPHGDRERAREGDRK